MYYSLFYQKSLGGSAIKVACQHHNFKLCNAKKYNNILLSNIICNALLQNEFASSSSSSSMMEERLYTSKRFFRSEGFNNPNKSIKSPRMTSVDKHYIKNINENSNDIRINSYASINVVDKEEELELEKDKAALRKILMWGSFAILCVITLYIGARRAKRRYFGTEGSAFVHVESRGKPALGGPFVLVNTRTGKPISQASFLGKWTFFYFGFTHCPEICPVELNRMTHVVNVVKEKHPDENFVPLFVSCDPNRDSLEAIEEYLSVFHPDFVGLVGTPQQVHQTCKNYRIYYSVPTEEDALTDDYLIDHSIAIFLFDPKGRFVDFFGNRYDENEIAEKVLHYMDCYNSDPTWTNW